MDRYFGGGWGGGGGGEAYCLRDITFGIKWKGKNLRYFQGDLTFGGFLIFGILRYPKFEITGVKQQS